MDMAYGTGFTLDLLNLAYEAVDNSKTDSGVTALLK